MKKSRRIMVTCCHCGRRFDERLLADGPRDRFCPLCNAPISEQDYDDNARSYFERLERNERQKRSLEALIERITSTNLLMETRKGQIDLVIEQKQAEQNERRAREIQRVEEESLQDIPSSFEILPNLVFHWAERAPGPPSVWAQVDCVALTRKAAVFIEVKRWHDHIRTSAPFTTVQVANRNADDSLIRRDDPHFRITDAHAALPESEYETMSFGQSRRSKRALASFTRDYPENRTLAMTIFVAPLSFESDSDTFAEEYFVGWCTNREGNAIAALEDKLSTLAPIMSQSKVDRLAEDMFETANDIGNRLSELRRLDAAGIALESPPPIL